MGSDSNLVHVFLVSFPGQGHVNPLLRLGKRLASKGLLVTFCTTESWSKQMREATNISEEAAPVGEGFIRFESFKDGWDEKEPRRLELDHYLPQLEQVGKQLLPPLIAQQHPPVSCLINNPFIPWVSDVAYSLGLPSAMLWVQSCACFSAYYHYYLYHKSKSVVPFPSESEPRIDVQLPCMPLLRYDEVPSFLYPTTPYPFITRAIIGQFRNLDKHKHKPFCVLMDSFLELEQDNVEYMSNIFPIKTVGPLFKYPTNSTTSTTAVDDCIEWLNSKPPSSVVYISFGTVVYLKQEQVDEIAYGLVDSGVSFLWVMKPPHKDSGHVPLVLPDGFLEQVKDKCKVVEWSPQEQVLAHSSVACFVTHCGWNSTMEALTSGVPLVAFPQWGDQVTNAKYLVDVFEVGVRMCRGEAVNELINRDEVKRCLLEATVGPKAAFMKQNAYKLKEAAEAAVAEGGSSDRNIEAFVEEVRKRSIEEINKSANIAAASVNNNNNNNSKLDSFSHEIEDSLVQAA